MDKSALFIIKIGGNIIEDNDSLHAFISQLSAIKNPFILVHGGGKLVSALSEKLGIQPLMIDGRRYTDAHTLDLVTMLYAGLISKKIVAQMQAIGKDAIGLCGADLNTISADKRDPKPVDYGFAGDIRSIQTDKIRLLLDNHCIPVFSSITHDEKGQLLNTNADTIASSLATALSEVYDITLCYCFEKNGVLRLPEDELSVIGELSIDTYTALKKAGRIHSGMIPKLDNAFDAFSRNVPNVHILHALQLHHFINSGYVGTRLVK